MKCIVEKLGFKGDGSVFVDGKEYFVPYVIDDEEIEIEILPETKDRAFLKSVLKPSKNRIEPCCPLFGVCGACKLQHIKHYDDFKLSFLYKTLKSLCPENIKINDITFIPKHTRRRALFNTVNGELGFFKEKSNDIVKIDYCPLLKDEINEFIKGIQLPNITASVVMTLVKNGIDVNISSKKGNLGYRKTLAKAFKDAVRLTIDEKEEFVKEKPLLDFDGYDMKFPAGGFLQPSLEGENALKNSVLRFLEKNKSVADIFCGQGTFSIPVSKISKKVCAYEIFSGGVYALNNLKIPNIKAFERDIFKNPLKSSELNKFHSVIIDPPRIGAVAQSNAFKDALNVKQIIYVSCNPATFVRDAKNILNAGFSIKEIDVVDQFVYTHHLEIVANFIR